MSNNQGAFGEKARKALQEKMGEAAATAAGKTKKDVDSTVAPVTEPTGEKKAAREKAAASIAAMSEEEKATADAKMVYTVLSWPAFAQAKTVFFFVNMPDEPDTHTLITAALNAGKKVAVPLCHGPGQMSLRQITSLKDLHEKGAFGIEEPDETAPIVDETEVDVALVPCMAATKEGKRLGHGGGYYDRYVERARKKGAHTLFALYAYEAQVFEDVPTGPHDQMLDLLITEAGVFGAAAITR